MNQDILQRAMFAMPLSKEARNTGIMQGFEDDMVEEDMGDEMLPMERTPQNPEILMNTLRGDMRSVDARYAELANMVGEEAAMETPPEVLAILQDHFTMMQQPQGIGALPQGMPMTPPGMMPQGPMPTGQGPAMPPGGMGGPQLPFPQGGPEGAPPTPDGLPPAQMAIGGVASLAARFAPYMAATGAALRGNISRFNQAANQALGRMFMQPQPVAQRVLGPGGRPLVTQGRNTMVPGAQPGTLVPGTGTKMAPYTTMGLQTPTFTQGISQGVQQALGPTVSKYAVPGAGALGLAYKYATREAPEPAQSAPEMPFIPTRTSDLQNYLRTSPAPSTLGSGRFGIEDVDKMGQESVTGLKLPPVGPALPVPPASTTSPAAAEQEAAGEKPVPIDIWEGVEQQPNWIADAISAPAAKTDKKGRVQRIKDAYGEYLPLYEDLIGADDTDSIKTNALLLLADAAFKFAGDAESPTMAVALSRAASGIPRGLAVLANDAKERGIKIKTAALDQAIGDISAEDKAARDLQIEIVKGANRVRLEQAKQAGKSGLITKSAGAGLTYLTDKDGGYYGGWAIDPDHPVYKSALESKYTLQPTSNPFVQYRGPAPTTIVTDEKSRLDLEGNLRAADDMLREIEQIEVVLKDLYGPSAWASDVYNNVLVPLSLGKLPADKVTQRAKTQLLRSANILAKNFASLQQSGRVSVQQEKWSREVLDKLLDPTAFFSDPRLAASTVASARTAGLNARQQVLTQLGFANQDLMAVTLPTGTPEDPFIVPRDETEADKLYNFLRQTVAKDPKQKGTVFLEINGKVTPMSLESIRTRKAQ